MLSKPLLIYNLLVKMNPVRLIRNIQQSELSRQQTHTRSNESQNFSTWRKVSLSCEAVIDGTQTVRRLTWCKELTTH